MDPIEIVATRGGFHLHGGPPARPNFCIRTTEEEVALSLVEGLKVGSLNGPYRYPQHAPYWVWRVRGDALKNLWDAVVFGADTDFMTRLGEAIRQDEAIKKSMPGRGKAGHARRKGRYRVEVEHLVVTR